MMKVKNTQQAGFSLIEIILYIAIVAIFISGAVLFAWNVMYSRIKSQVQLDVNYNLQFITQRVSYELKNAVAVYSFTNTDICLQMVDPVRNPTRIYLQAGNLRLAWGGGSSNCTAMVNDVQLNSNEVSVTSLVFNNLSQGNSKNIRFSVVVEEINTAGRQEWSFSNSYTSTVELKTD